MTAMKSLGVIAALAIACVAPASADWNVGDPHKMHYPQLPDPNGWDVRATWPKVLADDWMCSETGPVSDIHFWGSWFNDQRHPIEYIHVSIHEDIPVDPTNPYSRPGALLWARDFYPGEFVERLWGTGDQGWYDPNPPEEVYPVNHHMTWQYNITDIPEPFFQNEGTVYWLDISVKLPDGLPPWFGWKTSVEHWNDDGVWGDYPDPAWMELRDPITQQSLDLAFVITPEPGTLVLLALGGLCLRWRGRA